MFQKTRNMKRFLFLTCLVLLSVLCFGQTVETVSERFHYQYLKKEQTKEQIQQDNEERQRNWQEELEQMREGLISDNVTTTLSSLWPTRPSLWPMRPTTMPSASTPSRTPTLVC